ncbi:MAG: universal stress protein [Gammaproteobacteria bacterium]|nr:universal stress protein [Gammaproteobacteria bacterium]
MKRFNNILCVVTSGAGHNPALERAATLTENNQANLTIIDVVESVTVDIRMPGDTPIFVDLQAAIVNARKQELDSLIEPYRQRINIQTRVLIGTPFLEIIREILRNGCDLVIKSAEIQDWQDRLFSSDDMHLLRKCPCPVWIMLPEEKPNYSRVMAAVDFDSWREDGGENDLNRLILELASSIVLSDFAELHVIHAWKPITESLIRVFSSDLSEAQVAANVNREQRERRAQLERLSGKLRNWIGAEAYDYLSPQLHLRQGNARKEIPAQARRIDADLVVMGTVARTGLAGLFMGNTAETILNQINCAVLAVKPPGFVTPVTLDSM